jgi:hypothetical protein
MNNNKVNERERESERPREKRLKNREEIYMHMQLPKYLHSLRLHHFHQNVSEGYILIG